MKLKVCVALGFAVLSTVCVNGQTSQVPDRTVYRVLEQATWGPTQTPDPTLARFGLKAWFARQLEQPPSTFDDQPQLNAMGNSNTNMLPIQQQFYANALNGADQLRQRIAFALSEIWVVSELEVNNASAFPPLLRIFQADAFENYEQLMKDVTLNAGMGKFLNMVNNDKGNATRGTTANENYAREIMQLFTTGLVELNMDGTPVLDAQGQTKPTYTQATVSALAKAFTGWTYAPMPGKTAANHNPAYYLLPMTYTAANHDTTQKVLFTGYTLPAGQSAQQDLDQALHAIFMQPSVPPFVSKLLIQHLTTSNPSPEYVERVARVFADNGQGVRGDLQSVIKQILFDPEARRGDDPTFSDDATFGHLREPVLLVTSLLRGLNGSLSATSTAVTYSTQLGQNLFSPPSVFSYFSPEYRVTGGLLAPEFQLHSTQAATNRANLINSAIYNGRFDAGTTFNLSTFVNAASVPSNLVATVNKVFFHSAMSDSVKSAITSAVNAAATPTDQARAALYVALTSSEYQVIH